MFDNALIADDAERRTTTVVKVEENANGWCLTDGDGWSLFVTNEHEKTPPSVGESFVMFGRGIGAPVRGIMIGDRVYRYESPEDHERSQAEMCARLTREREEADAKFRASRSTLPSLPTFAINDADGWAKYVELNSTDPYSYECVRYAAAWANLMESQLTGTTVAAIAETCSRQADTSGITGFMYGAAVASLAKFWVRGDELRRWHNKETQVGDEGDRANESGGVLNPAMLSIGGGS